MLITLPSLKPAPLTKAQRLRAEIAKQESWLDVPAVIASSHWTDEITARITGLREQLARIGGAR